MPLQLLPLLHKMMGHAALLLAGAGGVAAIDFRDQITLGSIIVTCVLVAIAGLFTIRSKIANVWHEEAEGERAAKERVQRELAAALADRAEFDRLQQELRHGLKNELAAAKAQLQVMEARTDLTAALEEMRKMNEQTILAVADAVNARTDAAEERDRQLQGLLKKLLDGRSAQP